jgi:hypothetical protein
MGRYNYSQEVREDYGRRGHYRDEFEGVKKVKGVAICYGRAYYAECRGVDIGS